MASQKVPEPSTHLRDRRRGDFLSHRQSSRRVVRGVVLKAHGAGPVQGAIPGAELRRVLGGLLLEKNNFAGLGAVTALAGLIGTDAEGDNVNFDYTAKP